MDSPLNIRRIIMSHYQYTKKRRKNEHLRYTDRQKLEIIVRMNETSPKYRRKSLRQIARILDISPATISREMKRGRVGPLYGKDLKQYHSYSAEVAQADYDYQATGKGRKLKIGKDHAFAQHVSDQILIHKQSPDAIIMRLRRDGNPFQTDICSRTLYNYIPLGIIPGVEQRDLLRGGRPPKREYLRLRHAHKGDGKGIEERPEAANTREEKGHWEMDCIQSGKGKGGACLLTLVERKDREVVIIKLRSETNEAVVTALDRLERKMGAKAFRERFKSITTDNGGEFLNWRRIEASCLTGKARTRQYFCHPYSAWERGSVENVNGLIRRFVPKGTDISKVSKKRIQEIEDWINHLPRRILKGKSAKIASGRPEAA